MLLQFYNYNTVDAIAVSFQFYLQNFVFANFSELSSID